METKTCDDCGQPMEFQGYAYWELEENLDTLITDDPNLTPEDETWYCPHCDIRWAVMLNRDGTPADITPLIEMAERAKADYEAGKTYDCIDDFIADLGNAE